MRGLKANPRNADVAIAKAQALKCEAIAWTLSEPISPELIEKAKGAGLAAQGWLQAARDPDAAKAHPEWMHVPQHNEWLSRFPNYTDGFPAMVAPYIGLNTRAAFDYARQRAVALFKDARWAQRFWLADIQGPPMGCGCGNPACRSWDNAGGPKIAASPYEKPDTYFPLEFARAVVSAMVASQAPITPVICPECERGIDLDGVSDPDGPAGTDLCQGILCADPCSTVFFPQMLSAFKKRGETALLLTVNALQKDHPVFGAPRAWAKKAHAYYGPDLIPVVEPEDAEKFEHVLVLTDAPQDCYPVAAPAGYRTHLPPDVCPHDTESD